MKTKKLNILMKIHNTIDTDIHNKNKTQVKESTILY